MSADPGRRGHDDVAGIDGMHPFGSTVAAFDDQVDQLLERLRGHAVPDAMFKAATTLGDWSLIWHLVGALRTIFGAPAAEAVQLSALLGAESLLVNQGVKRLFRRIRPTEEGDGRYTVRRPSTSSFPSGHASAGFFAATVLTSMAGKRTAPLWFGLAGIVALSRPYVRIHHASDIVAGAAIGLGLGRLAVRARDALIA
ncbi:MAG: phosphatase PAP2 family protein [Acidimicrobiia bacterium]